MVNLDGSIWSAEKNRMFWSENPEVYILEDRKWKGCLLFQRAKSLEIVAAYIFDNNNDLREQREWD